MVTVLPNQKSVRALVAERYSVRKYLEKPVPQDVIRGIIDTARLAPSNGNSQPWHIAVVSGKARVRVEAEIFKMIEAGVEPHPVYPPGGMGLKGVHKDRQRDCGFRYYGHMNVAREDMDARLNLARENWKFYGAPHAAFISMPKTMHRANAIDLGIFCKRLCCSLLSVGSLVSRKGRSRVTLSQCVKKSSSPKKTQLCAGSLSDMKTVRRK